MNICGYRETQSRRSRSWLAMWLLLFGAAGTLGYWQGWAYLTVLWGLIAFAAMLSFLIRRRLDEEKLLATNLPGYEPMPAALPRRRATTRAFA